MFRKDDSKTWGERNPSPQSNLARRGKASVTGCRRVSRHLARTAWTVDAGIASSAPTATRLGPESKPQTCE